MSPTETTNFLRYSRISNGSDLQRELWPFILLTEDQWGEGPGLDPPDLRVMIRLGNVELSDQSHQECLHLDNTIQEAALSIPGRANNTKVGQLTRTAVAPDAVPNTSGE